MYESRRPGPEPAEIRQEASRREEPGQSRRAGWLAEFVSSGLALILPALAFTAAALMVYPPAARAIAPVAVGLTFVGVGLVLFGIIARRRL
jgi:hypothetical protein